MQTYDFLKKNKLKGKNGKRKRLNTILLLGLMLLATVTFATNGVSAAGPTTVLLGTAADLSVLAGLE